MPIAAPTATKVPTPAPSLPSTQPYDTTAYTSDPELAYEPEIFEQDPSVLTPPESEEPSIEDILNTPINIYIPGGTSTLAEPLSIPSNPENLSENEIKTLIKSIKPTCAGITASYSCGNHDNVPTYAGPIISVATGDEVARAAFRMNSLVISIVDIDGPSTGSGTYNGVGKIKIPMFNNAEVGVSLSGIQVAEGGCIVAGRAELSGVDLALLNAEQRAKLDKIYAAFVKATDLIYDNADAIAETINSLAELLQKAKDFAKNYKGSKAEAAKAKAYEKELKKAQKLLQDSPDVPNELKTALTTTQANAQAAWDFYKTGEPCTVSGNGGGGDAYFSLTLADCGAFAAAVEEETQAIEASSTILTLKDKVVCGCYELGILQDLNSLDKDCQEIIAEIDKLKSQINQKNKISVNELSFQGQVTINGVCVSDLSFISISKSDFDPLKYIVEKDGININNGIKLYISDNENRESKVEALRAYLYDGVDDEEVDEEKDTEEKYTPPEGAVDVSLLNFSKSGVEFLKKQEAVILHVYNDAKGGFSKYCEEHKSHINSNWYCTKSNHYGKDKNGDPILGKPTIGLGHLIKTEIELANFCGKTSTKDELMELFRKEDLPKYEEAVKNAIDQPITQYQYDALVSFVFNTGPGGLRNRGVFKNINAKNLNPEDMNNAFMQWRRPTIVISRREDEINLFNNGKYTFRGN